MTGARPNTWMPFYWADYRADTSHLSAIEHGGYILLIGHYWTTGKPLPMDDGQLARIASMTLWEWRKHSAVIKAFFAEQNGRLCHARIDAELAKAIAITKERSEAGARGAANRWQTDGRAISKPEPNGLAKTKQTDAPSPSQPPKDINNLISGSFQRLGGPSRADTNDPRVRKQRWEQRIGNEVLGTFGPTEGARIIEAYANGDPAAKQIFNALSDGKKIDAARSTR